MKKSNVVRVSKTDHSELRLLESELARTIVAYSRKVNQLLGVARKSRRGK
jgi:uncharacterized protein YhbP (UPF0306 family)